MEAGPPPAKKARVPKVAKVKNKMPAEVQITAEQLLQEAASTKVWRLLTVSAILYSDCLFLGGESGTGSQSEDHGPGRAGGHAAGQEEGV